MKPFHHERRELLQGLTRRRAHAKDVAIADAAFVEKVVEIQRVEALERRTHRLARGRDDAAEDDGRLLLGGGLGRILRVELHARLRIVVDQLQLLAQHAARRVQLLDRKRQAIDHRPAIDVETARGIMDARDRDRILAAAVRIENGAKPAAAPAAVPFKTCRRSMMNDIVMSLD